MNPTYSIRIDFDREQEHPQRVFQAMALYVEGFNDLQKSFMKGFDSKIEFSSTLNATKEGSCIAEIVNIVSDRINKVNLKGLLNTVYEGIKKRIAVSNKIDSEDDVRNFVDDVSSTVNSRSLDIKNIICANDANLHDVANALHKIANAKKYMAANDIVEYGRGKKLSRISDKFDCPRNAAQIFSDSKTDFRGVELLIVLRPSYVSDLKWEVQSTKHKTNKSFHAKMSDTDWQNKWLNHEVELWPGDAILAKVKVTRTTNKSKKPKSQYKKEIVEIMSVIKEKDVEQFSLEYK